MTGVLGTGELEGSLMPPVPGLWCYERGRERSSVNLCCKEAS